MGARNVSAVFTFWSHLDAGPFRVLAYMALVTKDDDDPPRYWGGWEALARALGRDLTSGTKAAHQRSVVRAVAALRDARALETARSSGPSTRAEYTLCLMRTHDAQRRVYDEEAEPQAPREHATLSGTNARRSVGERTTLSGGTHDAERRTKEQQDLRGTTEGPTPHPPTSSTGHARVEVGRLRDELAKVVDNDRVAS